MDETDRRVLKLLQEDNRSSASEIAERIGLSVSATSERVRKLNSSGVVIGNHALIDPKKAGLKLCAFVFVDLDAGCDEDAFAAQVTSIAAVQEAHHVTGQHSWLLKIRTVDTDTLQEVLANRIKKIPGVARSETLISLSTAKETLRLDL